MAKRNTISNFLRWLSLAIAAVVILSSNAAQAGWDGWRTRGGVIVAEPTCLSMRVNAIDCFVRGADNAMHHLQWNGRWQSWESLGGTIADPPSCVFAAGMINCFVRGADNAMYQVARAAAAVTPSPWRWTSHGGVIKGTPSCISWDGSRIDCFARGANDELHHTWNDGTWHPWENLGGNIQDSPNCISWEVNRIDCFGRGAGNAMFHVWYDGAWHPWESLAGAIKNSPNCLSWGPNRIDCFARGTDDTMHHVWYDGHWHPWESLGGTASGTVADRPNCVTWAANRLDCFARGADSAMHHLWYDGSWHEWETLGGGIQDTPSCASWGPNRLDCFVRGTDNALHHRWYGPGLTGYQVVTSAAVTLNNLSDTTISQPCPSGKVAIGAGYRLMAQDPTLSPVQVAEVERALEVHGATPVWPGGGASTFARVTIFNKHLLQRALVSATAICVDRRPDLMINPSSGGTTAVLNATGANIGNGKGRFASACPAGQVPIGGGVETLHQGWIKESAPNALGTAWSGEIIEAGFNAILPVFPTVVCASELEVPGRMVATSGSPTSLGALRMIPLTAICPGGVGRVLSAGVSDGTTLSGIDMVPVVSTPTSAAGIAWMASVHNRNLLGGAASVVPSVRAICAEATP